MQTLFIPSDYEAVDFLRTLTQKKKIRLSGVPNGVPVFTGHLGGVPIRVAICGMGQPHSARRIRAVLEALRSLQETEPVWLVGFGGGLDPSLKRYDIVWLPGDNSDATAAPILTAASGFSPGVVRRISGVYTSEIVLDTEEKKRQAFLDSGASIVDMETAPFLELLKEYGRTGAVLRVISDDVSEEFPADLIGSSYDFAQGKNTPFRLIWRLLSHPRDIFRLYHFLAPLPEARRRLLSFVQKVSQTY
jgi:purine-nucleoside phosphorylase